MVTKRRLLHLNAFWSVGLAWKFYYTSDSVINCYYYYYHSYILNCNTIGWYATTVESFCWGAKSKCFGLTAFYINSSSSFSSGEILSDVFSLSFTSLKDSQELVEPVQIIFKVSEKEVKYKMFLDSLPRSFTVSASLWTRFNLQT